MPGDEDVLASKILLNRANAKSRAKSWLTASTEESSRSTQTEDEEKDAFIPTRDVGDENVGIGVVHNSTKDDFSNRRLLSANESLKKQLLGKDAYKKHSEGRQGGGDLSRTPSKNVDITHDDEDEAKGKSSKSHRNGSSASGNRQKNEPNTAPSAAVVMPSKNRKRPGSYLDQLLADRREKKEKKGKRKSEDD